MGPENVITPTMDLDELDRDMSNWRLLSLDQRKRSDEMCILKYGRTNAELYALLRRNILLSMNKENIVSESSMVSEQCFDTIKKIDESFKLQKDKGLVIINPWIESSHPDYSKNQLQETFNRYLELPKELRDQSDIESIRLWGSNTYDMYEKGKRSLIDKIKPEYNKEWEPPKKDIQLSDYIDDIKLESTDPIRRCMRKLDVLSSKTSIYESTIINTTIDDVENTTAEYDEDIPMIVPWFTPDEMMDLFSIEVDPYDHILGNDVVDINENIKKNMFHYNDRKSYHTIMKLHSSYEILEEAAKEVIKLGWNPCVPFNEKSQAYARQRQIKWLRENKHVEIVDLSRFIKEDTAEEMLDSDENNLIDEILEPVHIVLLSHEGWNSKLIRGVTHAKYSHAGLSFDESMNRIYSFNAACAQNPGRGGFSIESIDFYKNAKNVKLKILTFFVNHSIKNKMKENIDFYIKNQDKSKYNYADIFRIAINKTKDSAYSLSMICSQFVDSMLKLVNIDFTGKSSNLVVPGDFDRSKTSKLFCLFNNIMDKFKPSNLKRKISTLIKKHDPSDLVTLPLAETVEGLFNGDIDKLFVMTENNKANEILNEIRSIISVEETILEAIKIPIRFDKPGNLYIDLPRDLESEYQEAHRLLETYNESNIQGIKHQLARLFYINSIIEKKVRKMKERNDDYKKLIDLRARVINDFKKYMTIVLNIEPDFDFETYMKNSEYYNKTVIVDTHTMKYTGKVIRDIIKLMM